MAAPTHARPSVDRPEVDGDRPGRWVALVILLATAQAAGLLGLPFTETGPGSWYDGLDKAPFNPPGAVFGPVWTTLYVLMAVAAWLVWRAPSSPRRTAALACYAGQLVLNAAWTPVFFGAERPGWGLAVLVAVDLTVAATVVAFARVRVAAAWMLAPYLVWVGFATSLNAWIVAVG